MLSSLEGPYDVILADPPWDYDGRVQHGGSKQGYTSGAKAFYPTMRPKELCAMDVKSIASKKSILFLWTTGPQIEIAISVGKAWGFTFRTMAFVWDKQRVNPGYYTMSQCEFVFAMVRGGIPSPRGARNVRQLLSVARTSHSAKPVDVHARIEAMFPDQKKLELFAREHRKGWDCWGNQV